MKETNILEFKERITDKFLKTVVAYANYSGGEILFGVNDDGEAIGLDNPDGKCLEIENFINNAIKPIPDFRLYVNPNKTITLLVLEGDDKPYFYKSKAYKRNDSSTVEMSIEELKRFILESKGRTYEEEPTLNQDLKFNYLNDYLKRILKLDSVTLDTYKTLNLYHNGKYNNAAYILSDECNRGIDIALFGDSISVIKIRKNLKNESILKNYDDAIEIFKDNYIYEVIEGAYRNTVEKIPFEAFREALANAIVHRAYDISEDIRILMFNDKIEIVSPGGLPAGINKDEYVNGDYSRPRNEIIASVFNRLRIIEKFGTGIKRIKELYGFNRDKVKLEVSENIIKVVLPVIDNNPMLTFDEGKLLDVFAKNRMYAVGDLVELTGLNKSKIIRLLNSLIDNNYVAKIGSSRATKYMLKR